MHDFLIRKFQNYNPRTGFLALYMPLFYNNYMYCFTMLYCFIFATFYKHPLSGSFLDRHATLCGRFEIPHYKMFTNVVQNHLFFASSQMFWCTSVQSDWLYIETWKWCIEKNSRNCPVYLLRVSNKDTTGIVESCSKWSMWRCFCAFIDNFEQVSQISFACLLPPLSIFCMWNVSFYSALFL